MAICGPKLSLCGIITSIWGIVQLTLMGIFFYTHSVALVEDVPLKNDTYDAEEDFLSDLEEGYQQNAFNCWIAAGLYLVTLLFSLHQLRVNYRATAQL